MDIKKISASSYQKYSFCQWSWYISYVLNIKDVAGKSAFLGSVFHDSMEEVTKLAIEKKYDLIKDEDIFEKNLSLLIENNKESFEKCSDKDIKQIKSCYMKYLSDSPYSPKNKERDIISAEEEFDIELPGERWKLKDGTGLRVKGFVDRIDRLDKNVYEVLDYKTGQRKEFNPSKIIKDKKTTYDMYYDIQLLIYLYYATIKFSKDNKNPVIIATLDFVRDGGPHSVMFDQLDKIRGINMVYNRFKQIESNDDPIRNKGWHCKHLCYYGQKTGICDNIYSDYVNYGKEYVELTYKKTDKK